MTRIHQPDSGLRATDLQRRMYREMLLTREINDRMLILNRQGRAAFAARSVMNLAISFDHRALDGAEAGAFMSALKSRLEAIGPDDTLD